MPPCRIRVQGYSVTVMIPSVPMWSPAQSFVPSLHAWGLPEGEVSRYSTVKVCPGAASSGSCTVSVSSTFLAWVFQYAGEIVILEPEPVCQMYRRMLETAAGNQDAGDLRELRQNGWKL